MRACVVCLSAVGIIGLNSCKNNSNEALAGFELHPEFTMELTASEPLVLDPVELHFDEHGDMFVLEMPGYPLANVQSRLVKLQDTNGDGLPDKRILFTDQLGVSSSFLPYRKGFLVASPPELIWIADTNGDGVEDKRVVLLEGFSNDNLQHNFNGLSYGLDNWIYIANGGNSGSPALHGRPETLVPLRGGDLKIHSNLDRLERVGESSGGYKLTFDNWGRLFETHNLEHNLHLVFEDKYLDGVPGSPSHALENISDHDADGLARVYPIGEQETRVNHPEQSGFFSGSCGITYYGGGVFPEEFSQGLFVADVVLNLVHYDFLKPSGSAFTTSRYGDQKEFLASSDRAFRPVNFSVGPDGSMYVLDMHREVIEHPEWIPDNIEKNLDLNAGKDQGRIYRIWPKKQAALPSWDFDSPSGLVEALGHPNQWVRNTAQRILVSESVLEAKDALITCMHQDNPLQRVHALWSLEGLDLLTDSELRKALTDSEAGIRENALRIAALRITQNEDWMGDALSLTQDPDARVRLWAVLTLSQSKIASDPRFLKEVAVALTTLLNRQDTDRWMSRAVTAALLPQAGTFLKEGLIHWNNNSHWPTVLTDLAEAVGRYASPLYLANLIGQFQETGQNEILQSGLTAVSRGWKAMARGTETAFRTVEINALEASLTDVESKANQGVIHAAANLRMALQLKPSEQLHVLLSNAQRDALDTLKTTNERLEWLQLAALSPFAERITMIPDLLDSRVPNTLQREVLKQMWESDSPVVPELLFEAWDGLGPESRKLATDILLYKATYHNPLLAAMESGRVKLGEFNLDLERRRALLFSEDAEIRRRAESLFSDSGVVQRAEIINQYIPAISLNGSIEKGKAIFTGRCASCHRIGALGVEVGPSLADIGRKSKETLLYDILDPNAAVDTAYLAHTIIDSKGTYYTGVVMRETDLEVELKLTGGELRMFRKDQIRRFSSSGLSLMPEGLEQGLTAQDVANLLTFLQAPK